MTIQVEMLETVDWLDKGDLYHLSEEVAQPLIEAGKAKAVEPRQTKPIGPSETKPITPSEVKDGQPKRKKS